MVSESRDMGREFPTSASAALSGQYIGSVLNNYHFIYNLFNNYTLYLYQSNKNIIK